MYSALSPGAVGVAANALDDRIAAAVRANMGGVEIDPEEVAHLVETEGAESVKRKFADARILPSGWGLAVDLRGDHAKFQADLNSLERLARAAAAIECKRAFTWIMPASDTLEFNANFDLHVGRLRPVAALLDEHGHSLGLEFIGPKTIRNRFKYTFVYDMPGMLELARAVGPNVGLLLDSWHLYTSHGAIDQIAKLTDRDVVYVHVNDAPTGVDVDEQIDNVRRLPGDTGVIDMTAFLDALRQIGYNGPVVPEPFFSDLDRLPSDEVRLDTVAQSMSRFFP